MEARLERKDKNLADDKYEEHHKCDTPREVPVCKVSQSVLKFWSFNTGVESMDMCILIPPYSPEPHQRGPFNCIAPLPTGRYMGTSRGLVGRSVLCRSANQVTN